MIILEVNGTFVEYSYGESFPTVRVEQVYVKMDPIGFVFLFFFAIVMVIQVGTYIINWMDVTIIISLLSSIASFVRYLSFYFR